MADSFDLFGDQSRARANYIRQIRRTVETYDIDLKVVLELLQNALDASTRNNTTSISIDIDLPNKRVVVTDDGTGFPPLRELLFLGGTDKEEDPDQKGKIGVGLKAVIFSSSRFMIDSISEKGVWHLEVTDADITLATAHNDWQTTLSASESLTPAAPGAKTGTTVTVEFRGNDIHDWLGTAAESVFTVEELG